MEKILSLLDSTDYALLIIQSTICSLAAADFIPSTWYLLIPLGIISVRIVIAFIIALGALIDEQSATAPTLREQFNEIKERARK